MINLTQVIAMNNSIVTDGAKFKATLLDLYPQEAALIGVLTTILEQGLVQDMIENGCDKLSLYQYSLRLQKYGYNTSLVQEAFDIWKEYVNNFDTVVNKSDYLNDDELQKINLGAKIYKRMNPQLALIPTTLLGDVVTFNTAKAALYGLSGTQKDIGRAYSYFRYLFFERNMPIAGRYLGEQYEKGRLCDVNLDLAFQLYKIAATADDTWSVSLEYAEAKQQMARLLIGKKIDIGVEDDSYYWYGLGCYLCAADDGNKSSYAILKSLSESNSVFFVDADDELRNMASPVGLLDSANDGDTNAMYKLALVYLKNYGPWFRVKYAKKWLKKGADLGNTDCKLLLISLLLYVDNIAYDNDNNNYEVVYQPQNFKDLMKLFLTDENGQNAMSEVLVVHSQMNILYIFDLMSDFIVNYGTMENIKELVYIYLDYVSTANSYVRVKPGLPHDL